MSDELSTRLSPAGEGTSEVEAAEADFGRRVGQRLRAIRRQKGMSLQDVEEASREEFKASVLGAYERGERAISVPRLHRLARFYNVPVDQLLPPEEDADPGVIDLTGRSRRRRREGGVVIDLTRLESLPGPQAAMLSRYLSMIQVQRQDFNGRVLTVRRDDLRAIACILDTTIDEAESRLGELGLLLEV